MLKHIQDGDGCLVTAFACVLEVLPIEIYEAVGEEVGSMVHIQVLIRYLLDNGHKPTLLERYPRFHGQDPIEMEFFEYTEERAVLCTPTHAYACHSGETWNTSLKPVDLDQVIYAVIW